MIQRFIQKLLGILRKGLRLIAVFLLSLLLGILVGIVYALPWILKIGGVIFWFVAGFQMVMAVEEIYTAFTPQIPMMALQLFVVSVQAFSLIGLVLLNPRMFWGALYLTAILPFWLAQKGIPALFASWEYADLFFRFLPSGLYASFLIMLAIQEKLIQTGKWKTPIIFQKMPGWINAAFEKIDNVLAPSPTPPEDEGQEKGGASEK